MNRSQPRRPAPRRGRSREPSPEIQEDETSQGPVTDETSTDTHPRRSTRNRRGSPTPPPAAVPFLDENDTAANGSDSQAQHAKIKQDAIKGTDGETRSNDSETEKSKIAGQLYQETEGAQSEPPSTSSTNDENKSKGVPSNQASSPDLEGNGEAHSQGIPTLSQEIDTFKGDNGASATEAKVKHAGSKHLNGPGDDHATGRNTDSGKKESLKEEHSGEAKVPAETIGEASATLEAEVNITASETYRQVINSSPRDAIDQEIRAISLGSKSALEAVEMEGNEHEDPMKDNTSPHVPVSEKALPYHEKMIPLSSGVKDKVRNASAHGERGGEKNETDNNNAPNATIPAKKKKVLITSASKLRPQDSAPHLSAADNASHTRKSLPAPELPNEIHTDSNELTISSETGNGPGTLSFTNVSKIKATKPTGGKQGSEDDMSRAMSVSKNIPLEQNNANPISTDDTKHSSMPRLESSASSSTVVSDVFAIDIRPTAKAPSKARRLSGDSTVSSSNVKTGKDYTAQVKGNVVLSDSRKRTLTNDGIGIQYSGKAHSKLKQQRREEPVGIFSSSVLQDSTRHGKARRKRPRRSRNISRQGQGDRLSGLTDVENVKILLYDIASRVYRGKGPERRFAAYWEALRRFLKFQMHQGPSTIANSLDGIHDVLNSFLVTRQMKKLHNLLVTGLLSQCLKDSVEEKGIREAVPREWHARVQHNRGDDLPVAKDLDVSMVRTSKTAFNFGDFDVQSDLWTAAGREPSIALSSGVAETDDSRISDREVMQLHRHEPRLPGALTIDPLVRGIVRDESSLKVSENAIWLLIVATRQYTETVVKKTVSNLESVRCERSLEPLEFASCANLTGHMGMPKSTTGKNDSGKRQPSMNPKKAPITPEKKAPAGEKRRRVTPLDIAAALNGTHLSQSGQSLAGSISSLAAVRCYQSSFNGPQPIVPPSLDSVQSFLVERIESATKKPRHEWRDPGRVPVAAVAPELRQQSPQKKSIDSGRTHAGLRQEPRKDAAFQVNAAQGGGIAKATTTARPSLAPIAGHEARPAASMTVPSPRVSNTPPAKPSGGNTAVSSPPPPTGVRGSPPSASPRGRGRGFGVKDLAAIRARSEATPPKQVSTPPAPGRESNPSSGAAQQATPTMRQQNGAGKELRRLQQVQGQTKDSPAAASVNGMPGMIPAVPVAGQPESMDTTQ